MKKKVFVIVACIVFLGVMIGLSYAKGDKASLIASAGKGGSVMIDTMEAEPDNHCEPMSQGFWKRLCHKRHPASSLFVLGEEHDELCEALQIKGKAKKDPCARAYSQLAALYLNLDFELVALDCPVYEDDGTLTDIETVLGEIEGLLGGSPDDESCKEAGYLAECINSRDCFEDPYFLTNLFDVEQNTFYKDMYAKISDWLNGFLKSS